MATLIRVVGWLFVVWFGTGQIYSEIYFWRVRSLGRGEASANPAYSAMRINMLLNHVKLRVLTLSVTALVIWLLVR